MKVITILYWRQGVHYANIISTLLPQPPDLEYILPDYIPRILARNVLMQLHGNLV